MQLQTGSAMFFTYVYRFWRLEGPPLICLKTILGWRVTTCLHGHRALITRLAQVVLVCCAKPRGTMQGQVSSSSPNTMPGNICGKNVLSLLRRHSLGQHPDADPVAFGRKKNTHTHTLHFNPQMNLMWTSWLG